MIKEIYLYNQVRGKSLFPELVIVQDKFFSTSFDLSLEELADFLVDEVRACCDRSYAGKIKIGPYFPNNLIKCENTSPLKEVQMKKFERYLPGRIRVEWCLF